MFHGMLYYHKLYIYQIVPIYFICIKPDSSVTVYLMGILFGAGQKEINVE